MKFCFSIFLFSSVIAFAQTKDSLPSKDSTKAKRDLTKNLPLEASRTFHLKTSEGTWTSLDISPDGKTIAFDMMGDIYLLPMEGGQAKRISKGLAYDSQPRWSPDGKKIAITSDRDGSENIWILDINNGDSTQVTKEKTDHFQSVEWTPDGQYLITSRGNRNLKLWMYHRDGGGGIQLIKEPDALKTIEPAFGADSRYIWFSRRNAAWNYNAQLPQYQIATYDRETGEIENKTNRYGSAFAPTLSPDGKWLVYGTRHDTHTGLVKRNLTTGDESWLAYPVQRDEQESIAPLGVLPAMSFSPDSKYFIASYGGKINKIPVDGGPSIQIPYQVDEELAIGPEVHFDYKISDDPQMNITQIRDPVLSPDGKIIAFTALDRLYIMDYPGGTPRRISQHNFTEAKPVWSPDSKSIAFVTWEGAGGNIYSANVNGGIVKLTSEPAYFNDLAWDANTNRIIFITGPAQIFKNMYDPVAAGLYQNIAWINPTGGALNIIEKAKNRRNPHFVNGSDRIYLYEGNKGLLSIRWDGTDEKVYVKVNGITTYPAELDACLMQASETEPTPRPSNAEMITLTPVGDQAIAQINNEIYLVKVPKVGGQVPVINVADPSNANFPSNKITNMGGEFAKWTANGKAITFSLGAAFFYYDLDSLTVVSERLKIEAKEKAKLKTPEKKDDKEDKKEDDKSYKGFESKIIVKVDRDIPKGKILLKNARLITMKGDEIIALGEILIENNRIVSVSAIGKSKIDPSVKVMDMKGKTIIPGFVDTHAHMWPAWGLHKNQAWVYAANLAYGVTTTRDPQTATTDVLTYSDKVDAGQIIGPRIYSTGPGVGFWAYYFKNFEQTEKALKQYSEYYNTKYIKMYLVGNRQHRQWVIEAAKKQGLMPTTEGGLDFKLNMTQLLDGYPGHEHALPIYPIYNDVVNTIAFTKMACTPTLLVSYGGPWAENYYYATENVVNDKKLSFFTPKEELDSKARRRASWFIPDEHIFKRHAEFSKNLLRAGGLTGVGSHGQLQGLGYHWELWSVQSGGMNNHEALKVSSIIGARALGLDKELGSLEPGKLADLIILDKNPLENIRNTNTISYVMKNGRLYNGNNLDQVYPQIIKMPDMDVESITPSGVPGISGK